MTTTFNPSEKEIQESLEFCDFLEEKLGPSENIDNMRKVIKAHQSERWDVTAESESGDDYGVLESFDHEPSEEELNHITSEEVIGCDGWTDEHDGPGWNGSWLHIEVEKV